MGQRKLQDGHHVVEVLDPEPLPTNSEAQDDLHCQNTMGKNARTWKKLTDPTVLPMVSFFPPMGAWQEKAATDCVTENMVGATEMVGEEPIDLISQWRSKLAGGFQKMETALLETIMLLITPLTAQV